MERFNMHLVQIGVGKAQLSTELDTNCRKGVMVAKTDLHIWSWFVQVKGWKDTKTDLKKTTETGNDQRRDGGGKDKEEKEGEGKEKRVEKLYTEFTKTNMKITNSY